MKIMNKIVALIIGASLLCSCGHKQKPTNKESDDLSLLKYENEFFTMMYPGDWEYEEEVNNACDTIPGLSKGIGVELYSTNPEWPMQIVRVQKSAMPYQNLSPEELRDLSISLKQEDNRYLMIVDECVMDNFKFGEYPAASVGFLVETERGDTIIHKQIVVKVDDDVYYLHNSFDWNELDIQEVGDAILSTVRFKSSKQHK